MIQYFSDSMRRGVIKIVNRYDGYVWDYYSQMWVPYPAAVDAQYDKRNFNEITVSETERLIGIWQ